MREQLRDTAQQGQRDEYGGDRIEDTAANAAMQAFRMASNVKLLQSHRSPPPEPEELPLPEPETEYPELPFEAPTLPEPTEESFGFSSTSQTGGSYIQEWLSAPPKQESVPQPDVPRTLGTVQPEQLFRDLPSNGTEREMYSQHQQISAVQQSIETVPQTAENRTIVPVSKEKAVDIPQRQPKTKELSKSHDISRTNITKQPELSVRLMSDESHTQHIKTREMYVKKQSGAFLQQNAKVSAVPHSDASGTRLPEQSVRVQQYQIKTREMYAKKHSPDSISIGTEGTTVPQTDLSGTVGTDSPELSVRSHQIKTREVYVQKHLAEKQNTELLGTTHSGESAASPELSVSIKTRENYIRKNASAKSQPDASSPRHSPKDTLAEKFSDASSVQFTQGKEKFIQERKVQMLRQQEIGNIIHGSITLDAEPLPFESAPSDINVHTNAVTQVSHKYVSDIHLPEPVEHKVNQGRREFIKQQKEKASKRREARKAVQKQTAGQRIEGLSGKPVIAQSEKPKDERKIYRLKPDTPPPKERVTPPKASTGKYTTMPIKRASAPPDSPLKATSKLPSRPPIKAQRRALKSVERSAKYTVKTAEKKTAKTAVKAPRMIAKVPTAKATTAKHIEQANRAKRYAIKASEKTKKVVKSVGKALQKIGKACADAIQEIIACIAAGGSVAVVIIVIVCIFGAALMLGGSGSVQAELPVSEEVYAYQPYISQYAAQYGIPEYVSLIMAVMQQESGGQGTDPMQAAECSYNTRFPNVPNGITDPIYSIEIGVHELADALAAAGVESPADLEHIKLALQGYNYGPAYITWAKNRGGYTPENAAEFSAIQQANLGWSGYGDPEYVPHVLRYYSYGFSFVGNQAIVTVAMGELGYSEQAGGYTKYGDWYGLPNDDWCAMFVSWCADKCGLLDSGVCPKMSYVPDMVTWFQSKGKWSDRTITPPAGAYIIFDWGGDGNADHVGLVESVQDGQVHTIEGNSGNKVRRCSYNIGSSYILGYGIPGYS